MFCKGTLSPPDDTLCNLSGVQQCVGTHLDAAEVVDHTLP